MSRFWSKFRDVRDAATGGPPVSPEARSVLIRLADGFETLALGIELGTVSKESLPDLFRRMSEETRAIAGQ